MTREDAAATTDARATAAPRGSAPQIAATLRVQPEVGAVAEHARQDERGRRGHGAAVVEQFVDVLRCTPIASASAGQTHGP